MALPYVRARAYALADEAWDDVYVTAALADVLNHGEVSGATLAVSIASVDDARHKHASLLSAGTLAWAQMAPPEMEESFAMERGELAVFVPLSRAWRSLYGAETVAVRAVQPVPLTSVYLAVPQEAYTHQKVHTAAIQEALQGQLVRIGEAARLPSGPLPCLLAEPVAQGVVDAQRTSVYLVNGGAGVPGTIAAEEPAPAPEPVLDETFLERSLARSALTDDPDVPTHSSTVQACAELTPEDVDEAVLRWRKALGADVYIDYESVVLVRDATLAALAAFHGDWALASVRGVDRPRLVRLFSGHRVGAGAAEAALAPCLAHNLAGDGMLDRDTLALTLHPLPTHVADELEALRSGGDAPARLLAGTPDQPPLVPRAEALSLARVASPLATHRAMDAPCLDALRRHLENRPRLLRKGDVFAVAVVSARARFAQHDVEQDEAPDGPFDVAHTAQLPNILSPTYARDAVYFCVGDLEADLHDPEAVGAQIPASAPALRRWYATLAAMRSMDSVGCWVDAAHTRIVQTGVVPRRVPDVGAWLRLTRDTPSCPAPDTPLTGAGSVYARFAHLVRAALSPSAQRLDVRLAILLHGAAGSGKRMLARWVAQRVGIHLLELNGYELVSDTDARTEGMLRARVERAKACAPCLLLLQNIDVFVKKGQNEAQMTAMVKMLQRCMDSSSAHGPVIFVGTTEDAERCPPMLLACFNQTLKVDPPAERERHQLLHLLLRRCVVGADVDLQQLAVQTAALLPADLTEVVERARLASATRLARTLGPAYGMADLAAAHPVLVQADLDASLAHVRASYSESIGAPKIPNVTWDDVGGLASVKDEILDTVQLPLEHPELFSDGVKKRSGVLLYGPPGTGKTLLAKAVATTCSLNFFSVKGPELLNMYIGESEANVRRVFQRARDAKPCVIFFDELDSVAPKRGNQGDSGGVMDRIVSQLLAELDGMASGSAASDVFVIGATNRPDLLDPALLRPGRFDRMLYLSVAETHEGQRNILQALTRKFALDDDVGDMSGVAELCPFNLTGADFYALCSDAMLKAMTEKAAEIDAKVAQRDKEPRTGDHMHWPVPLTPQFYLAELATPSEVHVRVHFRHFAQALHELAPSVSEQEMAHYREVQKQFSQPAPEAAAEPPAASEPPSYAATPSSASSAPALAPPVEVPTPPAAAEPPQHPAAGSAGSPPSDPGAARRAAKGKGKAKAP